MAPRPRLSQEGDRPYSSVLNSFLVHSAFGTKRLFRIYVPLKCRNNLDIKKQMIPARKELSNSSLPLSSLKCSLFGLYQMMGNQKTE